MKVLSQSVHDPNNFGPESSRVQPLIAAFGGAFLLMIFMDYFLADPAAWSPDDDPARAGSLSPSRRGVAWARIWSAVLVQANGWTRSL